MVVQRWPFSGCAEHYSQTIGIYNAEVPRVNRASLLCLTAMASHIIVRPAISSDVVTFPHMKVKTWYDTYKAFGVPDWELRAPPQEKEFAEGFEARILDPTRITGM